jgi:hypothetical protein
MNVENEVAIGMKPLFEKARKEKLLFRCNYQDILFTPDELEERQSKGSFVWGAVNWELVNPIEILQDLEHATLRCKLKEDEFKKKMREINYI